MSQSDFVRNPSDISAQKEGDVLIVNIEKAVLLDDADGFQKKIDGYLDKGSTKIVLNMEKGRFIASMMLASIVNTKIKANTLKGDIRLACVSQLIKKLLERSNIASVFEIYDAVEDAVASFKTLQSGLIKQAEERSLLSSIISTKQKENRMVKKTTSQGVAGRKANSPVRLEDYIEKVKARAFEVYLDRVNSGKPGDEIGDWVVAENEIKAKYNIA